MLNNRPVFVLLGLGILGACGDGGRQTAESDKDGGFAMRVEHDTGEAANVSIDLPAVKGRFTLPSLKVETEDIEIDGVRLYPGARVTAVDISGADGLNESAVRVRFDADAPPAQVRDYFLAAFRKKGVPVDVAGNRITGRDSNGKPFAIILWTQEAGTRGLLRMGSVG